MVFFNCNACGEALKKNQVEKHTNRCRGCQVLSCVDCGKDFWGNDYQSHTKCMTEEEKYCGPGHVSKVNKGEVKQEQWIEKVQSAIDKSASNPNLKKLLIRLKDYPNIPRKQQKFQNFLKNSLRIYDVRLCTQVWDTLMAHSTEVETTKDIESTKENRENPNTNDNVKTDSNGVNASEEQHISADEVQDAKKSKREKKEERRDKANKKEKKDKSEATENGEVKIKKSKKRKHDDDEDDCYKLESLSENGVTTVEQPLKKKKKKHSQKEDEAVNNVSLCVDSQVVEEEEEEEETIKKKKIKFNWEKTITKVLEDKGEMSLKKLRKKVLSEFCAVDAANYSEENLMAKFDKKVRKLPTVQVFKERAKLKE